MLGRGLGTKSPEAEAFSQKNNAPSRPGARGYYPLPFRGYFDFLDARMCMLERTQRRIIIVAEKNSYG